jgi:hypothetical protein
VGIIIVMVQLAQGLANLLAKRLLHEALMIVRVRKLNRVANKFKA